MRVVQSALCLLFLVQIFQMADQSILLKQFGRLKRGWMGEGLFERSGIHGGLANMQESLHTGGVSNSRLQGQS